MKYSALIFAFFIGYAACHVRFFDTVTSAIEEFGSKQDDINNFLEGVFIHFNLSSPNQIKECFNNVNAGLSFTFLQELNQILSDTKQRSSFSLHIDLAKIRILHAALKQTHVCIFMTQDFTDILDALGIEERDPEKFKDYLYLYYQAHYLDLFEGFKPIIDNLNTQSHSAAGDAFGAMINDVVTSIKDEGPAHLIFAAFGNGAAINLGIDEPDDSLDCYDKTSARLYLEFQYKLALSVAEGTIKEAPLNVYKFWDREGKEILSQIPESVFQCESQSVDIQKINQKLGIDITTKEYGERMMKFINNNRFCYYAIARSMKGAFESHNFHHAGSFYADILKGAADEK